MGYGYNALLSNLCSIIPHVVTYGWLKKKETQTFGSKSGRFQEVKNIGI